MTDPKTWSDSVPERFCAGIKIDKDTGCWEWAKAINTNGYGVMGVNGHDVESCHRVSWTLLNGPIPNNKMVLHKCDNKKCVNPDHLYIGDVKDNARDLWERGNPFAKIDYYRKTITGFEEKRVAHLPRGKDHSRPIAKLTPSQVMEIFNSSGSQRAIAKRYGLCQQTVSVIKNKKRWSYLHATS